MTKFSERLKKLRKNKGMSQKALAEAIGMSETGIQNYELETRTPNMETLAKLADYFDISTDYLIGRSSDPKRY